MRFLAVLVLALLMEGQNTFAELIGCEVCEKACLFKALEHPRGHTHLQKSIRKVKIKVSKKIACRAGRKRSCCCCCTRGGRKWGKADDSNYLSSDDDQRNINLTMLNDEDEVEDYLDQICDDFDEDYEPEDEMADFIVPDDAPIEYFRPKKQRRREEDEEDEEDVVIVVDDE